MCNGLPVFQQLLGYNAVDLAVADILTVTVTIRTSRIGISC